MNKLKMMVILGVIFCILPIHNHSAQQNNSPYIEEIHYNTNITQDIKFLIVEHIEGSQGLTVYIKNIGEIEVNDAILNTNIIDGPRLLFLKNEYNIPSISPGETTSIHIKPFGFSFGLFKSYSMVTFSIIASDIMPYEWGIVTKITGFTFEIISNYFNTPYSSEGYTLFAPEFSTKTYLIANNGEIVHQWKSKYIQALGYYLREDGCLVRTCLSETTPPIWGGGLTGCIEIIDWNNTVIWDYRYANQSVCMHHDIELMPNGNILFIAWEYKSSDEAIAAGRNSLLLPDDQLWADHIVEVKPTGKNQGEIVWEWHIWDHLIQDYDPSKMNYGVVADHPELIDINYYDPPYYNQTDWTHTNTVSYNEELDQIMLSIHNFNEIWIIDHSTTTEEAAGHTGGRYGKGGDLLYRWGNPEAYDQGGQNDQILYGQHDAQWIEKGYLGEGNILIFDNGLFRSDGNYSSIVEITPPILPDGNYFLNPIGRYGPDNITWEFSGKNLPYNFYSPIISGCQRLANGNTLICHGVGGVFFEVSYFGDIVWVYYNQYPSLLKNPIFKIRRYSSNYSGLDQLKELV